MPVKNGTSIDRISGRLQWLLRQGCSRIVIWPETTSSWSRLGLLLLIGLLAFFHNLQVSLLEGSEGLYAQVAREMMAAGEWFALTFQGEPYINKPPMFFWLLGTASELFGESESALRAPGAVFALATMGLTYGLGCALFSRTVGFWAAVVVATTHVFLWYGRRVLFDSTLTFAMTLAIFAWVRASMQSATGLWYLVAFLAMAFGAMIKSIHAFAMPVAIMVAYAFWQRDFRLFRSPWFWVGFSLYWILTSWYAAWLPEAMQGHFDLSNVIRRAFDFSLPTATSSSTPLRLHYYVSLMWFDFFPWSALIPASVLLLAFHPPLRRHPASRFVLLWFWGYLFLLTVSKFKRETYLMPLVPALGLMVGCYYQAAIEYAEKESTWIAWLTRAMFGLLALAFLGALVAGPFLLHRKWHLPLAPFPIWYTLPMIALSLILAWSAVASRRHVSLATVALLAIGFVIGVVGVIFPSIDGTSSPKLVNAEIRTEAQRIGKPIFHYGLSQEDLIFYLNGPPPIPRLTTDAELVDLASRHQGILLVTNHWVLDRLTLEGRLTIQNLRAFPRPRDRKFHLLFIHLKREPTG